MHGIYLKRTSEWFEKIDEPQLVTWFIENSNVRPTFAEAWEH
ncbi:DUF3291 domain-containing protein [Aminobacter sp. MDW-2]|nr:DUF3291 domain-containing protein [Aminobacter sp. MDW-2]QNH37145.1 DUF3291 domain-containing protein [Aminobacter sp. MDW-2]